MLFLPLNASAWSAFNGITAQYELQFSASDTKTPLWLNANKYGLSSLDKYNGYVRAILGRDIENDREKTWGIGYGLDFALPYNYSTKVALQQLFAEIRYRAFTFSLGSKCQAMEFKNQRLSSGSQTFGINARPVPQFRISIADYFTLPLTKDWISVKGHFSYGFMTDGEWQKDFSRQENNWTENVLYHSKAGYLKIGKPERPFCLELGLEMAATFGGNIFWKDGEGKIQSFNGSEDLSAFWHAFIPGGSDIREDEIGYKNIEGNQLGSWLIRLNYRFNAVDISLYGDHFFEDQSGMYNFGLFGYGKDGDWQRRTRRFYLYPLKDGMLGLEISFKQQSFVKTFVAEFMNTRYQSGPIYHDHNQTIFDQISGQDNYYNHEYYSGWQYYGQVIGNPLFLSPHYNDGEIEVKNNRFQSWHFGVEGKFAAPLSYRLLASWQRGLGTYRRPYDIPKENLSLLAELNYDFSQKLSGLKIRAALGIDRGGLLGDNKGMQLTLIYQV